MKRLSVPMDLVEFALDNAADILGYFPPHIMCSISNQQDAQRLAKLKCWSWEVDTSLDGDEWKLRVGGQTLYCEGA